MQLRFFNRSYFFKGKFYCFQMGLILIMRGDIIELVGRENSDIVGYDDL